MGYINKGSTFAVSLLFPALGLLALAARFASHRRKGLALSVDDWLVVPAWLLLAASGGVLAWGAATEAVGSHSIVPVDAASQQAATAQLALNVRVGLVLLLVLRALTDDAYKVRITFIILQLAALGLIRLVLLTMYRRIFVGKVFSIVNWTLIALVVAWTISFVVGFLAACGVHFTARFYRSQSSQSCADTYALLSAAAISDVVLDWCVLIEPIPLVWRLQMKTWKKVGVSLLFLVGIFSVGAGIARAAGSVQTLENYQSNPTRPSSNGYTDVLGLVSVNLWWAMMEVGTAFLVCNAPPIYDLARHWIYRPVRKSLGRFSPRGNSQHTPYLRADSSAHLQIEMTRHIDVYHSRRSATSQFSS